MLSTPLFIIVITIFIFRRNRLADYPPPRSRALYITLHDQESIHQCLRYADHVARLKFYLRSSLIYSVCFSSQMSYSTRNAAPTTANTRQTPHTHKQVSLFRVSALPSLPNARPVLCHQSTLLMRSIQSQHRPGGSHSGPLIMNRGPSSNAWQQQQQQQQQVSESIVLIALPVATPLFLVSPSGTLITCITFSAR